MSKLNDYLRSHNVSRRSLSKRSGLDLRTISRICEGRSNGRMDTWRIIARALNCRIDDIMDFGGRDA